ncbi:MAG: hypothetical protein LC713_06805, partial [Actinobacteria bacterium]|nr:hypothetical protein [Actinomycetota bacterium]
SEFTALRDAQGCARALLMLANAMQFHDDPRVLAFLEESAERAREADDGWCLGHALGVAGFERSYRGDLLGARPLFEECLAVAREAGDRQGLRFGLIGLG